MLSAEILRNMKRDCFILQKGSIGFYRKCSLVGHAQYDKKKLPLHETWLDHSFSPTAKPRSLLKK